MAKQLMHMLGSLIEALALAKTSTIKELDLGLNFACTNL